jgi:hypothetical protein
VFDTTGGPYPTELTPEGFRSYHNGIPHGTKLSDAVRVEPTRDWPTSTSRDYKGARTPETFAKTGRNAMTNSLADAVEIGPPRTDAGPPAQDSGSTGGNRVESWATPKAQNARGNGEIHGDGGPSLDVQTGGKLNPSWVETLQGFPIGWTQLPYRFKKGKR